VIRKRQFIHPTAWLLECARGTPCFERDTDHPFGKSGCELPQSKNIAVSNTVWATFAVTRPLASDPTSVESIANGSIFALLA
jgi:hypothetical protein